LQKKREGRIALFKRYAFWFSLRLSVLIILFVLVEVTYRSGLLAYFGSIDAQNLVYSILQRILFTLVTWFGLAVAKKIIVPTIIVAASPAVEKLVREPTARMRTFESVERYLTYIMYIVFIIAIAYIWAFAYVATWITGILGTGLIVALTFVLGLFTSSVLGNVLAYVVLDGTIEFKRGDRVQIGDNYGDIVELGFFFNRIKTIKNEIISIPNLAKMGKEVKNFSALKAANKSYSTCKFMFCANSQFY
jgi:small-conductance mechanosensitive channel